MTTVALAPVRRWIRRTQASHRERGERLGNFYFAVLFVLIVGGMVFDRLREFIWPATPTFSFLAGVSLTASLTGLLFLAMRRLGPLAIGRPAASWLLTSPVSRRQLLMPSLRLTALAALVAGGLGGALILGHAGPRPVPAVLFALAALGGLAVLLVALGAQAGRWWGLVVDQIAYLLVAAGLAGLVLDSVWAAPGPLSGWPHIALLVPLTGAVAVLVVAFFLLRVREIGLTPNDRILEAAKTAGTLADSAFGVEPSFVVDMIERRYWARRRLRSAPLWGRLPVLTAQDLRLALRRPRRLLWLLGATALPALLTHAPAWLLGLGILAGGFVAAGTSTATVRSDAANPFMLRMLGLSSRQAITQRLLVPGVIAGLWSSAALLMLQLLDALPAGPWWLLGLVLGPVGAVAAVRKARVGFVDNALLPLDTPMGTVSTGPTLASLAGFDALLLGVPALIAIASDTQLSWTLILVQAAFGALGARAYIAGTTSADRVQLAKR
ncbi:DUF6297 family protein [Actinoplanes sp. NPDC051633]|uniref:DUF6297 family protein n=1 Tax=Actinoplanes sp. NPDC051633 TaxID=3155670 RepID=UPI003445EF85